MGTSNVNKGKVLHLDGKQISFFGQEGYVSGSGKSWVMTFFGGIGVEVNPAPVSPQIEEVINADIAAGKGDQIDHLQVNARTAVRLFLEGKLTRQDVEKAEVMDKSILLSGIEFNTSVGPKRLNIVVEDIELKFATIDIDGRVV